jgi:hypothetical protein
VLQVGAKIIVFSGGVKSRHGAQIIEDKLRSKCGLVRETEMEDEVDKLGWKKSRKRLASKISEEKVKVSVSEKKASEEKSDI